MLRARAGCGLAAVEGGYRRQRDDLTRRLQELLAEQGAARERSERAAAAARQRRDAELDTRERERAAVQQASEALRERTAAAQTEALEAAATAERAARARDELVERSQLHRLAAALFGDHEKPTLDRTKTLFVVSLSAIVALIGTLLAAMHYAAMRPESPSRLSRAVRAYYARRRRRLPLAPAAMRRVGAGGKAANAIRAYLARRRKRLVVTREVERSVERLKLVYVPLDATEEEVASIRRANGGSFSLPLPAEDERLTRVGT